MSVYNTVIRIQAFVILVVLSSIILFIGRLDQINLLEYVFILVSSILVLLLFYLSKNISLSNNYGFFGIVYVYILSFVTISNALYYKHWGLFFEYTGSDSMFYDSQIKYLLSEGLIDGLINFTLFTGHSMDDYGMLVYGFLVYSLIEDILFLKFMNTLILVITCFYLYKISRNYLNIIDSRLLIVAFGASSYILYYASSGLKESLFSCIIVIGSYFYLKHLKHNNLKYLLLTIVAIILLYFFRSPVSIFMGISLIISYLLSSNRKASWRSYVIGGISLMFVTLLVIYIITYEYDNINHYLNLINPDIDSESFTYGGIVFRVLVFASGLFGPFPTIVPINVYLDDYIWSTGLMFKMIFSYYFIKNIQLLLKNRDTFIIFCLSFIGLHILALIWVEGTFKVRYVVPYISLFYFLVIYGLKLGIYSRNSVADSATYKIAFVFILAWNYMRI